MVTIVGVGNPLMGDDGVGVALVDRLAHGPLPPGVAIVDGGTAGVALLDEMERASAVILVDAAELGRSPGVVVRLAADDLARAGERCEEGLQHPGIAAVMALGRELGILPERVTLFLVQVERVAPGIGLTDPVREALGDLGTRVLAEAEALVEAGRPMGGAPGESLLCPDDL